MNTHTIKLCVIGCLIGLQLGCQVSNLGSIKKPLEQTGTSTAVIKNEAQLIEQAAPEQKHHTDNIIKEAEKIDKNTASATKIVNKLEADLAKEQESSSRWLRSALAITIFASGLAVAVTLALFFFGHIKSLVATVIAVSVFGAAVAMQILLSYMVYIAGGFAVLVGGTILWYALKHKRAQEEIVKTVEESKNLLPLERFKTIANGIQSKFTKSVVDRAQGK